MNIVATVEDFFIHKALGRALVVVGKAAASFALAHAGVLQSYGIGVNVDPDKMAAGLLAGAVVLGHYVGSKIGDKYPRVAQLLGANVAVGLPVNVPAAAAGAGQ